MTIKTKMTITAKNHILRQNANADTKTHPFSYVAIGDGGATPAGMVREPTGLENKLYNTIKRFNFDEVLMDKVEEEPDKFIYKLRLPSTELIGVEKFSEVGIEDENHNLLTIGCFESTKLADKRHIILDIENSFVEE